jgi:hypothetical protein
VAVAVPAVRALSSTVSLNLNVDLDVMLAFLARALTAAALPAARLRDRHPDTI